MVLVTGASGFLGSELVSQLLQRGEPVRALKRESSVIPEFLKDRKGLEWYDADILDHFALEDALQDIDRVYHCAAMISFDPADKKKLHQVNALGTANLVNLCLEKKIVKLLHVSSVAAAGEAKQNRPITEKNHWEFNGKQHGYSISKYESEMEVWRGIAEGLNAVIVNPSVIIGKNAGIKGSGELFSTVRKGLKFYTAGTISLVDVEDAAKAMILLMESGISGERFIISAETWPNRSFLQEIAAGFGIRPPAVEAKPWMLSLAWRGAAIASLISGKRFKITKDTARSAVKQHYYSNEKLKNAVGIEFKPIKNTIHEICKSLKETHP